MKPSVRKQLWRSTVTGMYHAGWLPVWQKHGGRCTLDNWGVYRHKGGPRLLGAFLCNWCDRVVIRGEGRWWM